MIPQASTTGGLTWIVRRRTPKEDSIDASVQMTILPYAKLLSAFSIKNQVLFQDFFVYNSLSIIISLSTTFHAKEHHSKTVSPSVNSSPQDYLQPA